MEIPDIALVTKADMGAPARRALADLKGALSLAGGGRVDIAAMLCSASTGEGVDSVVDALAERAARLAASDALADARRAQAALWARGALVEAVGQVALERVSDAGDIAHAKTPFQRVAMVKNTMRHALVVGLGQLDTTL
jgi:LAO/AO transport system kinase